METVEPDMGSSREGSRTDSEVFMLEYARIFQNLTAGVFFSLWAGWGKDMMIC